MYFLTGVIFVVFIAVHTQADVREEWTKINIGNNVEYINLAAPVDEPIITEDNVTFYLSNKLKTEVVLKIGDNSALESFRKDWKTSFAIHGYNDGYKSMQIIVDAYLATEDDYNVISVDWSGPAHQSYPEAVKSLEGVGAIVAKMVDFLVEDGLDLYDLNIVGWSLGAHVAGVAGNKTDGDVGRVTGLDPAGPLIELYAPQSLLRPSYAANVEVIHTDEGTAGYVGDLGHIDFYPNNGSYQLGCGTDVASHGCSHRRAPEYFAESITTKVGFVATKCSSWEDYINNVCSGNPTLLMGAFTPKDEMGEYYLKTNSESPYAIG